MGEPNKDVIPAQREAAAVGESGLVVSPQTLAESLDDDFVEVCNHVSAGDYLAAVTVAAWGEYRVEQLASLSVNSGETGLREQAAGTVALALHFYHLYEDLPDHPILRHHLLAA